MYLLLSLVACQVMDQPGHAFAPVEIVETVAAEETSKVESPDNEEAVLFEDPQEDLIVMGTEVPSEGDSSASADTTVTEDTGPTGAEEHATPEPTPAVVPAAEIVSPVSSASSSWKRASVRDGWKPALVGTVMDGPSPHAILQMPSGEKVVVQAGDMLADDGVIVMTIGSKFVDLAVVNGLEGRASIQNITLTAQY